MYKTTNDKSIKHLKEYEEEYVFVRRSLCCIGIYKL